MNDTFMKTKPVFPLLVSMALPNVISMLVNSLYNIVDSLFVAQINEQAQDERRKQIITGGLHRPLHGPCRRDAERADAAFVCGPHPGAG